MPISEKQLEANRRNAQLSTGPRTPEGKKRVALNAMRHALSGQIVTMTPEEQDAFGRFSREMIQDLGPVGRFEVQLAMRIAKDSWRINRISAVEDNIFSLGQAEHADDVETDSDEARAAFATALTFTESTRRFELLSIYEQRTSRALRENVKLLEKAQANRNHLFGAPKHPVQNGFVFADKGFAAAAGRPIEINSAPEGVDSQKEN